MLAFPPLPLFHQLEIARNASNAFPHTNSSGAGRSRADVVGQETFVWRLLHIAFSYFYGAEQIASELLFSSPLS